MTKTFINKKLPFFRKFSNSSETMKITGNLGLKAFFKQAGTTLIECLAVIAVIGGLVSVVASSFVLGLKSYVGQYASESLELELQRASLEMDYYISRSSRVEFEDPGHNEFSHNAELGNLDGEGDTVKLLQRDGREIEFKFLPDSSIGKGDLIQGSLQIVIDGGTPYTYTENARFHQYSIPGVTNRRPFWATENGGVAYRFEADTKNGVVRVSGNVIPE